MAQVSRRKLNPKVWDQIYRIFLKAIKKTARGKETQLLINFLLTETEKIVLTKRLAIALLLEKGLDYDQIKSALKVSQGTIASVKIRLGVFPEYKKLINDILNREELEDELWELAEVLGRTFAFGKGGSFWYNLGQRAKKRRRESIFSRV